MSVPKKRPDVSKDRPADAAPLTFAENIVLTVKLLAGLGLLGAVLWAADLWTAAN